jgi:dTMP kinase
MLSASTTHSSGNIMRGKFITFEGPEGSGKSTHIKRVADFLDSVNVDVVTTREPGGTALGEKIRALIQHGNVAEEPVERCELLLFLASRAQHVQQFILPALSAGKWVLCDRFYDSTFAYQGFGRGINLEQLKVLNRFAVDNLKPDLTLLIDVAPEISRERLAERQLNNGLKPDRIESENDDFHARLRAGFLKLAEQERERFAVINAEREQQCVADEIRALITSRFLNCNH